MKKISSISLTIMLLLCFMTGCSSNDAEFASYYDAGLDLISLSRELAGSEEYLKSYTTVNEEGKKLLGRLASSDDLKPAIVFSLDISDEILRSFSVDTSKYSENVAKYLRDNAVSSIASMINIKSGGSDTDTIIASSIASASMTFDHVDVGSHIMYLYIFENSFSYAVTFKPGYDNSVFAEAHPIFDEALSNCRTVDDIIKCLKSYDISSESDDISIVTVRN